MCRLNVAEQGLLRGGFFYALQDEFQNTNYYLEMGNDHILKQKPAAYAKPMLFVVDTRYMEAEKIIQVYCISFRVHSS